MIKAILIDDERPALRMLNAMLKEYADIEVVGMYTDPQKALDEIEKLKPQVVFLDIHMPQLHGIDVARRILDTSPGVEIVFVTAYKQYALEAFSVYAMDYLLKPIAKENLDVTVNRLRGKVNTVVVETG